MTKGHAGTREPSPWVLPGLSSPDLYPFICWRRRRRRKFTTSIQPAKAYEDERSHGIMRIPKNLCMLLPKALKMRAIKDTMALVADSIGCTKGAPAQMSWHLRHLNPALLNRQGMSTHPKMENGPELCHWKGQLITGLCADPIRPCKPPQIGAKCNASMKMLAIIRDRALQL